MTLADAGVIESVANTGAVTVSAALLEVRPPVEAVTVVLPSFREDAVPLPFIVATALSVDAQIADPERLAVLPSE